ncbi:MAG TPA: CBS domain-containing protein [Planctomycetes bacterium]|nr:CBS domain-containing protein [Planctomycetota bacterium]
MFVRLWMTENPLTVGPKERLGKVKELMEINEIRRIPVVQEGNLLGLVTEGDLRILPPERLMSPASEIMVTEVLTISPYAPLEDAVHIMRSNKVGSLPVVHEEKLVGIITDSDLFHAIETFMEAGADSARLTFDLEGSKTALVLLGKLVEEFDLEVDNLVLHRRMANPGRKIAAMRVRGDRVEEFVERLWTDGYRVLQVEIPHPHP